MRRTAATLAAALFSISPSFAGAADCAVELASTIGIEVVRTVETPAKVAAELTRIFGAALAAAPSRNWRLVERATRNRHDVTLSRGDDALTLTFTTNASGRWATEYAVLRVHSASKGLEGGLWNFEHRPELVDARLLLAPDRRSGVVHLDWGSHSAVMGLIFDRRGVPGKFSYRSYLERGGQQRSQMQSVDFQRRR